MIMTKAPFRVSFIGGGSDLRSFYERNGYGAVVSTSIDKYMHIMLHPYFHDKIRIKYSRLEDVAHAGDIKHPIVRECLRLVRVERGVEIASIADVPAGTGVGSSSAFTVCLLHALHIYKGRHVTRKWLAEQACRIEIDILKEPIGKQDQYAASCGGLNYIRFNADGTVHMEPLLCKAETRRKLERRLMMFYVGNARKASSILSAQKENMKKEDKFLTVKKLVGLAGAMRDSLRKGRIAAVGELMHEGWLLKREIAGGITSEAIDDFYRRALGAGALGGKLLGAGGGGFLLFYCEPSRQNEVRRALGLRELGFRFNSEGTRLVYYDH
jgi:D-glycero-alpha-D-manno-heptose-7-phosphate kinase